MFPKNSHGFSNVSTFHFVQNVSIFTKCFQVISDLGTRFSAMDKMCLTSMQLTQYYLDLFQPIKAENMALISSNWKTPQKAFFRAISGLRVFLMAPINWKRSPSPTRRSKNRIDDLLGQNSDVSKKFPRILKCFYFLQNLFKFVRTFKPQFFTMNKMYPNSMQFTRYNLNLFQPIKAENLALIGSK